MSSSPLNHFKRLLTRGRRFITAGAMAGVSRTFLVKSQSGKNVGHSRAWRLPSDQTTNKLRVFPTLSLWLCSNIRSDFTEILNLEFC